MEPGKPLSFLEHRIQTGNSLLGTTPRLLAAGIPDEAFQPIEGDTKEACTKWRKVNKSERRAAEIGAAKFAFDEYPWMKLGNLAQSLTELDNLADDTIDGVRTKSALYESVVRSSDYLNGKLLADAWCAAFVWPKDNLYDFPITEEVFRRIERLPESCETRFRQGIETLAGEYRFFHWHLAFPDVFHFAATDEKAENERTGWSGGFDAVLGNPPWERIKLQEREWFAARSPEIANAPNAAARGRLIQALSETDPALLAAFQNALRTADGESALIRNSGRYPLCGVGDINTYAIFAENDHTLLSDGGRMGVIVPTGIATDSTTKAFFGFLVDSTRLVSLYDFENAVGMFEGVGHGRFKFCLLTIAGSSFGSDHAIDFVFFAHHAEDLVDASRHFSLTPQDISLINPNTLTCPIFRSGRDAEITRGVYRRVPVLINEATGENPWGVSFMRMLDMSNDSHLFRTREQLCEEGWSLCGNVFEKPGDRYLPLYEAKMMHQFQHRYGDYAMRREGSLDSELPRIPASKLDNPNYVVQPRYWVPEWEVIKASSRVPAGLARAVEEESEERAQQIFSAWLAGYALNRNQSDNADQIMTVATSTYSLASFVRSSHDRASAQKLEQQFPLREEEIDLIREAGTFLDAAEHFVVQRVPRWFLGFRRITNATNERTSIASAVPPFGLGDPLPILTTAKPPSILLANLNSLPFDYCTRQKVGGTHLDFHYARQLPVRSPEQYDSSQVNFIFPRVLELMYTAYDISGFANELGYAGPPFNWNPERRFLIRCEIDALYFHLYGISRDDAAYILDTFPIVRRKDEAEHAEYRTKRVILEIYDAMAACGSIADYQTRLDPPPGDPRCCHAAIQEMAAQSA